MNLGNIFRRPTRRETEGVFTVGTLRTTPDLFSVEAKWPRPRAFVRVAVASAVLFVVLLIGWSQTANVNLVPGILFVGSFGAPLACVMLFFEFNIRRNVPFYAVVRAFVFGGVLSVFFSTWLFNFDPTPSDGFWDCIAPVVEEPAKLFAVVIVARAAKGRFLLNGLLFGAAVGAGFAAFESAGYSLMAFLRPIFDHDNLQVLASGEGTFAEMMSVSVECMNEMTVERGVFAPFTHVVWTALAAGGLWSVWGEEGFHFGLLSRPRFVVCFLLASACHAVWNMPSDLLPCWGVQVASAAAAWCGILFMVRSGIREVREDQEAVLRRLRGESSAPLLDFV